ncbi:hypothetical protein OC957_003986 [Salmonella enterica]|nr:hypothetical protein N898_12430 [Salmonella enterica subsp. arizonae serovar 62:z36:- str. RKS2983]EAO6001979.1 hypothetical protein [Salmonella enterica subsp. arizonae serovar 62:z36:-]EAP4482423.1 hypothetical protein [Salmonella enterica]EAT8925554.1 hypothetical protein [Salmonella enterica subsp. arizonae serovar 63:z4,z32:-]ECG1414338.1 hypothetical protein [Salmonella enterica subsp. arizonae str. CFSAN000560]ECG8552506.1 hypothetical protein [Salmonella enterica subsp. arizonae]KS
MNLPALINVEVDMLKYISLIVALLPMYYSMANSFDLPTVHSIKNGTQCEISFNDKVISKHDCEYESPSYLTSYSLLADSWTGVWIFQDSPMGNACEAGAIRIISMDSENKIRVHKPIDYCMGSVVINNDSDKVKINIQNGDDSKNSEVWIFKDNKLVKLK